MQPSQPPPAPPPIRQPSASHPLQVLEIGDSLGEDLGLGYNYFSHPLVDVLQEAVGDTGLANEAYYYWPGELEAELHEYHPSVVMVMLGGNDGQSFVQDGQYVQFGTQLWHTDYSQRVSLMMDEAVSAGAWVLWVGMPDACNNAGFSNEMLTEDQVYEQQVAEHPGVSYLSAWDLFDGPPDGCRLDLRSDGFLHLDSNGMVDIAQAAIAAMHDDWHISLGS